jgi:hypothetical protein
MVSDPLSMRCKSLAHPREVTTVVRRQRTKQSQILFVFDDPVREGTEKWRRILTTPHRAQRVQLQAIYRVSPRPRTRKSRACQRAPTMKFDE